MLLFPSPTQDPAAKDAPSTTFQGLNLLGKLTTKLKIKTSRVVPEDLPPSPTPSTPESEALFQRNGFPTDPAYFLELLWDEIIQDGVLSLDYSIECATKCLAVMDAIQAVKLGNLPTLLKAKLRQTRRKSKRSRSNKKTAPAVPTTADTPHEPADDEDRTSLDSILATLKDIKEIAEYLCDVSVAAMWHVREPGCADVVTPACALYEALEDLLAVCDMPVKRGKLLKSKRPAFELVDLIGGDDLLAVKKYLGTAGKVLEEAKAQLGDPLVADPSRVYRWLSLDEQAVEDTRLGAGLNAVDTTAAVAIAGGSPGVDNTVPAAVDEMVEVHIDVNSWKDVLETGRRVNVRFILRQMEASEEEEWTVSGFVSDSDGASSARIKAVHVQTGCKATAGSGVEDSLVAEDSEPAKKNGGKKEKKKQSVGGALRQLFCFGSKKTKEASHAAMETEEKVEKTRFAGASALKNKAKACGRKIGSCFAAAKVAMMKPIR